MKNLFEAAPSMHNEPLAARMRPRTLDEFVGQDHIIGPGRLLRRAIQADLLSSLVFYGPPGSGKTTLARIIAGNTQSRFVSLNAVLSGVADIRREIDEAKNARSFYDKRTILFVDEVHRWNKSQQDALLPWVENGIFILIGATTENPYFEVNKALVSRSRVFQLKNLGEEHLFQVARQALKDHERGYGKWTVQFESGALEHLVRVSAGDARSLLNALQLAVETTPEQFPPPPGTVIDISVEVAEQSIQQKAILYDKEGDYHFDTISAFIKSIRGSDPDAALYWMALMIRAGEEPRFIFRRMLISACEDVGLAAPEAIQVVESCAAAFDRVGLPEGHYHLTHACLYLATVPKSNSALGFFDALETIDAEENPNVPNHLRDGNRDKHAFGHGEGYKYPHAWREHWTAQQYLPEGLTGRIFYRPGELGYEAKIRDEVMIRREAQIAYMINWGTAENADVLSYSPGDDERERWVKRSESDQSTLSLAIRNMLFSRWKAQRHQRVFIPFDPGAALLWEANRRVPEGGVTALCSTLQAFNALKWLAGGLPELERPILLKGEIDSPGLLSRFDESAFRADVILARNWLSRYPDPEECARALKAASGTAAPLCELYLAETIPGAGTAIADLIPANSPGKGERASGEAEGVFGKAQEAFRDAEGEFLKNLAQRVNTEMFREILCRLGWNRIVFEEVQVEETRFLSHALLERWFLPQRPGGYGHALSEALGRKNWQNFSASLITKLAGKSLKWRSHILLVQAQLTQSRL